MLVARLWGGGSPCAKVKLICFVDTLTTLTSVNIEPALFSSLSEQNQASAWSITLTIREVECVIVCSEALICWLEVLEEKKAKRTSHRWTSIFQIPNSFPAEMHLGQRSCSPVIYKSLVSLFAARQCAEICCLYSELWKISFPVWAPSPGCKGRSWCTASLPFTFFSSAQHFILKPCKRSI